MSELEEIEACRRESQRSVWYYKPGVFRERFVSPFEQYRDWIGQRFTVVRQLTLEEVSDICGVPEDECQDVYVIRFEDGTEITAFGEEVCVWDDTGERESTICI